MLQNFEWTKITAEDFLLENLPAKIKIHEYFEASNSHVARTKDRFCGCKNHTSLVFFLKRNMKGGVVSASNL